VACTLFCSDNFASLISSRIPFSATLALNSGEWFFRLSISDRLFRHAIHLSDWSEIPRTPLSLALQIRPCSAEAIAFGPRVVGVKHVLMRSRDPPAAGDFGDDRGDIAYCGRLRKAPMKLRIYNRVGGEGRADLHFAPRVQQRHSCTNGRARRGAADLARLNCHGDEAVPAKGRVGGNPANPFTSSGTPNAPANDGRLRTVIR